MALRFLATAFLKRFETKLKPLNSIEISQGRILHNYDLFQKLHPGVQIWPVLKSNAYGHGLIEMTQILKSKKFAYIVLDSYYEALKVKTVSDQPILLIGTNHPSNLSLINFKNITLSVQDLSTIKLLGKQKRKVKIHLKINTGMNRQGFGPGELDSTLKELKKHPNIQLEGVFTHLADADNTNNSFTQCQKSTFRQAVNKIKSFGFQPKYVHLSATAGAAKINDSDFNAIRLGLGLYGYNPLSPKDKYYKKLANLKPALRMFSTIVKIQKLITGDKVSYNGIFEAKNNTKIAVMPVGYFEGLNRKLSNSGFVKYHHRFLPIRGRICMNLSMFETGDHPVSQYDRVEVISWDPKDKNSLQNISRIGKILIYELLVKINESVRRIIVP